jgi:hypothetical protein
MKIAIRIGFIFALAFILAIWISTPWLVGKLAGTPPPTNGLGAFGDIFGATNALFSGLAFLGLIYTIYLQREDLKQNMVELRLNRQETAATNEALRISGLLAALPVLIDHQKNRLHALASAVFRRGAEVSYGIEEIKKFKMRVNEAEVDTRVRKLIEIGSNKISGEKMGEFQMATRKDELLQSLDDLEGYLRELETLHSELRNRRR